MEVKIETDGDKWTVQIDDGPVREFPNRVYALIHLNNQTLTMVAEEE